MTSRPAARSVRTQDDEKGRIVRRLRTNHGGIFAAFLALFLQLALTTVTSAALPDASTQLEADLAILCTPTGAAHQGGAPLQPGNGCDHCTLCPSFSLGATLPSLTSLCAPMASTTATGFSQALILVPSSLERPSSRGPPSFHI
ncbi:MAG: hypothetical protein H3C28_02330 [Sphingomonadales bacterium]|nr:hypothetical protein [Sphingomonadales bacterium]